MSNGARVRILGAAWNVVEAQGKWHSPLVVSKDSKEEAKERERRKWKKNGRKGNGPYHP